MSVIVTGLVWKIKMRPNEKLVLLRYADHAAHDGTSIFPSVASVAEQTGYSERSVQLITRSLQAKGLLVRDGKGPRGTNKWRVGAAVLAGAEDAPVKNEAKEDAALADADLAPVQDDAAEGEVLAPVKLEGVQADAGKGPVTAAAEIAPAQNDAQRGADPMGEGVRPTAPEPSLTVNEPSTREAFSQTGKDQAQAKESRMIDTAIEPSYTNRDKIPEQYLRYADAYHALSGQEPTKRVLHDWLATFREWGSEQFRLEHVRQAYKELGDRFTVTRPGSLTNTALALQAKGRSAQSTMNEEALRKTQQLLAEIDRHRARRSLPPPGLRERVLANIQKLRLKTET